MKIGIITFHHNNNYGAALQCFALRKVLCDMGHQVSVINYIPSEAETLPFWRGWGFRRGNSIQSISRRLLRLRHETKTTRIFEQFRTDHFSMTPQCSTDKEIEKIALECDAIIAGSDQVWVFERSPHYFLKLTDDYKGLRISYAACCGHDCQKLEYFGQVREWLSNMDWISVRNDFSKRLVSELTDKPIEITADPTLLVNFADIQKKRQLPFDNYILVYCLSEDRDGMQERAFAKIRERVGDLPIVAVVANSCPQSCPLAQHQIFDASPEEWVWLIANAAFVYTDSFHGVLFAIKYHKLFIAVYTEGWRSLRLLDIAKRYGVEANIAHDEDDALQKIQRSKADYQRTDALVREHVIQSKTFLTKALGNEDNL